MDTQILTVQIFYILPTRDAATEPATCSNFGNKILRILDVILQMGNQWSKLAGKEYFGNSATLFAGANKFGLL